MFRQIFSQVFSPTLNNRRGFTLVEIMIVIAILGALMALLAPRVTSNLTKAKVRQAYLGMGELSKELDLYYTDCGHYPSTEEGLKALLDNPGTCPNWGPEAYIKRNLLKDPWGHDYQYSLEDSQPLLTSYGADGKAGGDGKN